MNRTINHVTSLDLEFIELLINKLQIFYDDNCTVCAYKKNWFVKNWRRTMKIFFDIQELRIFFFVLFLFFSHEIYA